MIGVLSVLGVIFLALSGSISVNIMKCERVGLGSVTSPDDRFRAEAMLLTCDKEDYLRTEVRLTKVDGDPNKIWGVFGAQSKRLGSGTGLRPVPIDVAWLAERELQIIYPTNADVFMEDNDIEGIKVIFVKSMTMYR